MLVLCAVWSYTELRGSALPWRLTGKKSRPPLPTDIIVTQNLCIKLVGTMNYNIS